MARSFFPSPETADLTGLVAISAHMDPLLLMDAYSNGLFPWSNDPVAWYSPDPRAVFFPDKVHISRRLRRVMRQGRFSITCDTAFTQVMQRCAENRSEMGTWITPTFIKAYSQLHQQGHAHSIEVWQENQLVGGIYGVQVGRLFCGESMFHRVPHASNIAFANLIDHREMFDITCVDAQVLNAHTAALGAIAIPRKQYLNLLHSLREQPCRYRGVAWPNVLPSIVQDR